MALTQSIGITSQDGAIVQAGSFDQRTWIEVNEESESGVDYFRETVGIATTQWPSCTLKACQDATADVQAIEPTEEPGYSYVVTCRYWIENRKTSPKAYSFEMVLETRHRYKNGVQITEPEE